MSNTILQTIRDTTWLRKGFETMAIFLTTNGVVANLAGVDMMQKLQEKVAKEHAVAQNTAGGDGKKEDQNRNDTKVKKYTVERMRNAQHVLAKKSEGGKNSPDLHEEMQGTYYLTAEDLSKVDFSKISPSHVSGVTKATEKEHVLS